METTDIIKKGKCCITDKPLKDCKYLNVVALPYKAKWKFPVMGNVLTGEENRACALVHDSEFSETGKTTGPVKYAVEYLNNEIIYHPVETLEPYPQKKTFL